jgi:hypothetical protein
MEKIISDFILVIGLFLGSGWGIKELHDKMRSELVAVLKQPSPSLSRFTQKLTR